MVISVDRQHPANKGSLKHVLQAYMKISKMRIVRNLFVASIDAIEDVDVVASGYDARLPSVATGWLVAAADVSAYR
jgi:hypothetical protein